MATRALFLTLTFAIWLGTYALRTYVPSAVWNLADEIPLALKPLLAVGTQAFGLAGAFWIVRRRRRVLPAIAYGFAAISVLRQVFLTSDAIGPWLSMLSWIAWLMLMAALANEIAAHDEEKVIAPAVGAAFALQIGMQGAWHGLDLQSVSDLVALAAAIVIALMFAMSARNVPIPLLKRPHTSAAWLLLGPALFLQITLASNVGRFGQVTAASLMWSCLLLIAALFAAVVVATRVVHFWLRLLLVGAGALALFAVTRVSGFDGFIMLALPFVILGGLHSACMIRVRISGSTACTIGLLFLFAFIFAFYNFYELPLLWVIAFAPFAFLFLAAAGSEAVRTPALYTTFGAAAILAALHAIPANSTRAEDSTLTIATFNIHHGFNDDGVPGMRRIADEIASMNADAIALQEIGRGWTLLGGNDLIAYLRWRFPDAQVFFQPTNGQLWGNAIMTTLPAENFRGGSFDAPSSVFRYGWAGADLRVPNATFPFYSVHLTADLEGLGGGGRVDQTNQLLRIVGATPLAVVAGDFNALPTDSPISLMRKSLHDLGDQAGLGSRLTWPAGTPTQRIDYIFASGMRATAGEVRATTASDHLPVAVRVLVDTTAPPAGTSNRGSQPGQ